MFKKIREIADIRPRNGALSHETNEDIWGVLNTALGRGVDLERSFKAQGFVHGVMAYFAAFDSTHEEGIERADSDLEAFYKKNYPTSWKAIVDGIPTAINSTEYREGIRLGFAEMENAARCSGSAPNDHVNVRSHSLLAAKGLH